MEDNKITTRTERVYYVRDNSTDKEILCGKCVNYPVVSAIGDTLEELEQNVLAQIEMLIEDASEIVNIPGSLEMVEKETPDDWLWSDVNSTYWEIERLKYLLSSNAEMRDQILEAITGAVQECNEDSEHSMYIADKVVKAIQQM